MLQLKPVLVIASLLVFALMLAACGQSSTPPNVTAVTLTVDANGCSPNSFNTDQGFLIKVLLDNTKGTSEASFVYPDGPYTFTAPAGQQVLGNFTSPTVEGRYQYQCGLTGTSGMSNGTMVVR